MGIKKNTALEGKEYGVSRRVAPAGMLRHFHFVPVPENARARNGTMPPVGEPSFAKASEGKGWGFKNKKNTALEGKEYGVSRTD